jgi:Phage integrase, N-terminal SAM-like domain
VSSDVRIGKDGPLIEAFLAMLAAETGAARNTLSAYRSDLALSSDFLEGRLAMAGPVEVTGAGAGERGAQSRILSPVFWVPRRRGASRR